MHARRPLLGDLRQFCCAHCERARRALGESPSYPTAGYLAAKAKLEVVTGDGEIDPGRLHGPDLAAWQLREARSARGSDLDQWMQAARREEPAAAG